MQTSTCLYDKVTGTSFFPRQFGDGGRNLEPGLGEDEQGKVQLERARAGTTGTLRTLTTTAQL